MTLNTKEIEENGSERFFIKVWCSWQIRGAHGLFYKVWYYKSAAIETPTQEVAILPKSSMSNKEGYSDAIPVATSDSTAPSHVKGKVIEVDEIMKEIHENGAEQVEKKLRLQVQSLQKTKKEKGDSWSFIC